MFPIFPHLQVIPLQPVMFPQPQPLLPPQPAMVPFRPLPPLLLPPQQQLVLNFQPFPQPQPVPHPQFPLQPQPFQQPLPQPLPAAPAPAPGPKTVYVLSYSSEVIKNQPGAVAQLKQQHCPNNVPTLLTVFCYKWRVPPPDMCRNYSGVSPQVQQFILGSRTAMGEINKAVAAIVDYLNAGHAVASIQTTCHAGTHRSVAAAEIIAQKMRRRGVSTVVTHAHRQRGPRDSF